MKKYNTKIIMKLKPNAWEWDRYCVYCTKLANHEVDYDHYDKYDYFNCDCDQANLERQIFLDNLRKPKVNLSFIKEVEYHNALLELNRKYNK